ncbi:hypothetical protein BJ508DRAFT_334995 [Ascobolus immersus RN42]|uniref:Uncharacterized protein n=1 Tax=Ascobolus immersus RN42 TaxID=1160509 RepID=A0A3N4HE74_ASCIM|nr:hypothetical protein BJ508DRAFT_334995 [Ascobolus immersus RN42]
MFPCLRSTKDFMSCMFPSIRCMAIIFLATADVAGIPINLNKTASPLTFKTVSAEGMTIGTPHRLAESATSIISSLLAKQHTFQADLTTTALAPEPVGREAVEVTQIVNVNVTGPGSNSTVGQEAKGYRLPKELEVVVPVGGVILVGIFVLAFVNLLKRCEERNKAKAAKKREQQAAEDAANPPPPANALTYDDGTPIFPHRELDGASNQIAAQPPHELEASGAEIVPETSNSLVATRPAYDLDDYEVVPESSLEDEAGQMERPRSQIMADAYRTIHRVVEIGRIRISQEFVFGSWRGGDYSNTESESI